MAESSMFWTTGVAGDGLNPYTDTQTRAWIEAMFGTGVVLNSLNALAPTCAGSATPVAVDTGSAFIKGIFYTNTASVNVTVDTPAGSVGTTGFKIVIRTVWKAVSAQTVTSPLHGTSSIRTARLTVLYNETDTAAIPGTDDEQADGTLWDLVLATGTITSAGVIVLTNARTYCRPGGEVVTAMIADLAVTTGKIANDAVTFAKIADDSISAEKLQDDAVVAAKLEAGASKIYARRGGSASDWSVTGATSYLPPQAAFQCGTTQTGVAGTVIVNFPIAFSNVPIVVLTPAEDGYAYIYGLDASSVSIKTKDNAGANLASATVYWLAIGPF